MRPSKQRAFGNNLHLISNLFGVYNIVKSGVVQTCVTTNQQQKKNTSFNLLYLLIILLYKKEKKGNKKYEL